MQDRTAATWEQASPRLSPYGAGSHDHELHVAGMCGMIAVSEHHGIAYVQPTILIIHVA